MLERSVCIAIVTVVAAMSVAWILRHPLGNLARQFSPNRLSVLLRTAIFEGRSKPSTNDHVRHSRWVDESGTWWSRESIIGNVNNSKSQQRIPMLIAWPSDSPSAPSPVVFVLHGTSRSKSDPAVKGIMARFSSKGDCLLQLCIIRMR